MYNEYELKEEMGENPLNKMKPRIKPCFLAYPSPPLRVEGVIHRYSKARIKADNLYKGNGAMLTSTKDTQRRVQEGLSDMGW